MAVPKKKVTRSRAGKRRGGKGISAANFSKCPHCGQPKLSHRVCPNCGYYRGEPVVQLKE
ncbi:MAG: 50S ribosomal protein L32 [Candidatus Tritonobacter lacicola]|nr:50S ribosomal protein L32 [Candidatus Tritonobacter lacicola]